MRNAAEWWTAWAPYWEHIEDRHAGIEATEKIISHVKSPVLVIGAGHGLIVQQLLEKGFEVQGIDLDPAMIAMAKKRRSLEIIRADAAKLPFENASYKTIIISTGVVDYLPDISIIRQIINEALRVTEPHGYLFVTFYKLPAVIERIYRNIGVIVEDRYQMDRIFKLYEKRKESPMSCVPMIAKWTGRSYAGALLSWAKLGLTPPAQLKEEDRKVRLVEKLALEDGKEPTELLRCAPSNIPYRNTRMISDMFLNIGLRHEQIMQTKDCMIVPYYKSGKTDEKKTVPDVVGDNEKKNILIRIRNLTKKYKGAKTNAVDSINLDVENGTIFGILGPNGAGKTTTLSILCGLLKEDGGQIHFDEALSKRGMSEALGLVPQNLALYDKLTGRENLQFFGMLYRLKGDGLNQRIAKLLKLVGLEDRADDLVKHYSTGMMRRLNLAAGLLHEPDMIFLDEPTVGIDPQSRNCIFEAVMNLKNEGKTILYTTHYMEEADRLCDKIVIMDRGKIILEGNPKEAVENYGLFRVDFSIGATSNEFIEKISSLDYVLDSGIRDDALSLYTKNSDLALNLVEQVKIIAKKNNVKITFKNIFEPTLESLFLDITGRSLRDSPEQNNH